jgi:hypothetical protein
LRPYFGGSRVVALIPAVAKFPVDPGVPVFGGGFVE